WSSVIEGDAIRCFLVAAFHPQDFAISGDLHLDSARNRRGSPSPGRATQNQSGAPTLEAKSDALAAAHTRRANVGPDVSAGRIPGGGGGRGTRSAAAGRVHLRRARADLGGRGLQLSAKATARPGSRQD